MLGILEQSTGAEVNIVTNDKANFEVVLRMWASDLGFPVHLLILLKFKNPVQLPGTLVEQTGRNQKTIKLVFFIIVGVGFGLRCGCVVGGGRPVMETKIRVSIR